MDPYPCYWRLHGKRPGNIAAAPWQRGFLLAFSHDHNGKAHAIVATEKGDLCHCPLEDVTVDVNALHARADQ